jgi:hypothetical protein
VTLGLKPLRQSVIRPRSLIGKCFLALQLVVPLVGLNAGLFNDAPVLRIKAGFRIETPISVISEALGSGHPTQFHGHLLVVVEAGASATLVETHRDKGRYFSNWVAA